MVVIGVTGPSGAGKGTVSRCFASLGVPVIDADAVYHRLLLPPSPCLLALTEAFGEHILNADGTLNRPELAKLVFSSPDALERLNAISHRFVMENIRRMLEQWRKEEVPVCVLDAPQLFEAGADRDCDVIVSVLADQKLRLERIVARDRISPERAMERIRAQKSDDYFRAHADYVIENNGSEGCILPQVQQILAKTGGGAL